MVSSVQVEKLGLNDLTIHDLRRTVASRFLRHTNDLAATSKLLGHSSIELTAKHYAHVTNTDLATLMEKARIPEGVEGWLTGGAVYGQITGKPHLK